MNEPSEDPVLKSARREAIAALLLFTAALAYTVTYCVLKGYHRPPESLTFILGMPDWVFWGVLVPWLACSVVAFPFALRFMKDADLGGEPGEDD